MSRPDSITAKDDGQKYLPHPEGQFPAVCVDVIDLGEVIKTYADTPAYLAQEVAVVFWTGRMNEEAGTMHEATARMTVSMGRKANLRKFLEDWRGRSYSDDEAEAGVPLHKLVNQSALVTVEQKKSGSGRTYAKIQSITRLPNGLEPPALPEYTRPAFWLERKEENGKLARAFKKDAHHPAPAKSGAADKRNAAEPENFDDFPEDQDAPDDGLAF